MSPTPPDLGNRTVTKPRGSGTKVQARMRLVEDTPFRIVFRYTGVAAMVFAVVMSVAAIAVFGFIPSPARWIFVGACGLFAVIAGVGGMWRDELEIDLSSGYWKRRAGFAGRVQETRGTLADFREVTMGLTRRTRSDDNMSTWDIAIQAPTWEGGVVLDSTVREELGYAALKRWALRLRLDAVDRTGETAVRTPWTELDRGLVDWRESKPAPAITEAPRRETELTAGPGAYPATRERVAAPSRHPPLGSRIRITHEAGRTLILLPPLGWNSGATFMTLFGLAFGGFGGLAMLISLNVIKGVLVNGRILDGPAWGFAAFCSVFFLAGLLLILGMIVGSRASEFIEDARVDLLTGVRWLGMEWSRKQLPKRAIQSIDLSQEPLSSGVVDPQNSGRSKDVRIRTDTRVVRLGRNLTDADQHWLRETLESMVRRG